MYHNTHSEDLTSSLCLDGARKSKGNQVVECTEKVKSAICPRKREQCPRRVIRKNVEGYILWRQRRRRRARLSGFGEVNWLRKLFQNFAKRWLQLVK